MKFTTRSTLFLFTALVLSGGGCDESTPANDGGQQPPRTDAALAEIAELLEKAAVEDYVRVIVGLKLPTGPFTPEGDLDPADVEKQRQAIITTREALVESLAAFDAEVYASWDSVPHVALKVNLAALRELVVSPLVDNISEDTANGI